MIFQFVIPVKTGNPLRLDNRRNGIGAPAFAGVTGGI
jgi:hypothetical protein